MLSNFQPSTEVASSRGLTYSVQDGSSHCSEMKSRPLAGGFVNGSLMLIDSGGAVGGASTLTSADPDPPSAPVLTASLVLSLVLLELPQALSTVARIARGTSNKRTCRAFNCFSSTP